jgi:hypothetical protein
MKRFLKQRAFIVTAVVAMALVSAVAFAQASNVNVDFSPRGMMAGFFVGQQSMAASTHKVTKMLAGSITVDFASATNTCVDSSAITVTGAVAGDPCFVGAPTTIVANTHFSCYVSAADAVRVRYCPAGTAADPLSATYSVRVVSNQ